MSAQEYFRTTEGSGLKVITTPSFEPGLLALKSNMLYPLDYYIFCVQWIVQMYEYDNHTHLELI